MTAARPSADQAWFAFSTKGGPEGADSLEVFSFSGREERNEPYRFDIELVSKTSGLDLTGFLGKKALLSIFDRSGGKRLVHGVIARMEQLHTANFYTHYRCELVPRLRFLEHTQDHKIFQNLSVDKIIEKVLAKHRFTGGSYEFYLRGAYPDREYCVQYGESDLHFISRLCEEEGIHFFFEHEENGEKLCFWDAPGGQPIPGENSLRFFQGSGQQADTAVIARVHLHHRVNSDKSTCREWNFTTPTVDITGQEKEPDAVKAPVPNAMQLETYRFPHIYQDRGEAGRYAGLQLERQLTWREWIEAESDVARFLPGFVFTLHSHPREDINRKWAVVSVEHAGEQPGVLRHEAPDGRGLRYDAKITAIPYATKFIPELRHPKYRVDGLQSALVTGPSGEEVYTDRYGRVKVQFHWDRFGKQDEKTTCWVRVADRHAGDTFGTVQVPRVGQEVTVEFMEGDPDRPVVTGRWYNTDLMPPWALPRQKTLSGWQSREFKEARRNQLVFDDTQGQIQAQISSDHNLSQLNLGYLTRINHVDGRKDFRGEGFELRTDDWGVVRAARGMYIGTDKRERAAEHHKALQEPVEALKKAAESHENTVADAKHHRAQDEDTDGDPVVRALHVQADETRGPGMKHEELSSPHLLVSGAAGAAFTAAASAHIHAQKDVAVTSDAHCSVSANGSFLASAMDKVRLFARDGGLRFMAAKKKLEIQAQSDALDAIAEKVASIISASGGIKISSPKTITLAAGGSYVTIGPSGIEQGTPGRFSAYAASHDLLGPRSKDPIKPDLPKEEGELELPPTVMAFNLVHAPGHPPLANEPYKIFKDDTEIDQGRTDENGMLYLEYTEELAEFEIEMVNGHRFHVTVVETHKDGIEGQKERLARDGFRTFIDTDDTTAGEHIFKSWQSLYGKKDDE